MRMSDLIVKKRDGQALTTEEIRYVVDGYTRGEIPDYQMSAMLMAIYFRGMDRRETLDLTMAMMHSGETLDLSGVSGIQTCFLASLPVSIDSVWSTFSDLSPRK